MQSFNNILAIVNPTAGHFRPRRVVDVVDQRLTDAGWQYTLRETANAGDVLRWARSARAEGFDLVVVAGGDGTIREACEGLMRSNSQIPLLQVPTGTANITARAMSIPIAVAKALDLITKGKVVRFDVGYMPERDRYFTFVAGAGYDARLIHDTPRELKKRFGFFAYVGSGIKHFFSARPVRVRLEIDRVVHELKAHTVMAVNIGRIPQIDWSFAPNINPHDGKLNIVVMSSRTLWSSLTVLFKVIFKSHHGYAHLKHFEGQRIRVESEEPLPVEIDGEALGTTPFLAEIIPNAMQFVVPIDYRP
jgi:diacylglycerol kinase (ATP)